MRVMRAVSGTLELGRTTAPRRAFKSVDLPAGHRINVSITPDDT